jgi:hypothetical protein
LVSKYKLLIWPIHNFFTKNSRRVFNNAVFDANFKFVDEVSKKVMGESLRARTFSSSTKR